MEKWTDMNFVVKITNFVIEQLHNYCSICPSEYYFKNFRPKNATAMGIARRSKLRNNNVSGSWETNA